MPGNYLFRTARLTKIPDPDKYKYSDYDIGFDGSGRFSLSNGSRFGKKVIIFCVDMRPSIHIGNKKKDILIPGKDLRLELDSTTVIAEKKCY